MKVVINSCYGGFGLSDEAILRYAELKGIKLYPEINMEFPSFRPTYWTVPTEQRTQLTGEQFYALPLEARLEYNELQSKSTLYDRDIPRNDPTLIQVIEELGNKADGRCANLRIIEIPDDVSWQIEEYDGHEHIAETHRTWS
jgi:hypothetical protein